MKSENNNNNIDSKDFETSSLKDYINLIRYNLTPVVLIVVTSLIVAVLYAVNARDIYRAETILKVSKPQGNILESPLIPGFNEYGSDRFIANEIEIIKSYNTRERVAAALIDSVKRLKNQKNFFLILDQKKKPAVDVLPVSDLAGLLIGSSEVNQKRGLDIIEITAESPSPYEAALIANCYANEYQNLNLDINRNQLTFIKNFLYDQRNEKLEQLKEAEEVLRSFQEKGGIVSLDAQATSLIEQLSQFEAQKNGIQIDLMASDKVLDQLKQELAQQNPRLADYLKSVSSETYLKTLQEQLAKLEVNKDLAISSKTPEVNTDPIVKDYDKKIKDLKDKLDQQTNIIKAGIFASSPEEVKDLSQKIVEEEIKNQSLGISLKELEAIVSKYDQRFNKLPKTSIELAGFQRNREALEKLYTLVEEKYQEAVINEQSQPGNVLVIDNARIPSSPSKPNRFLIIIIGLVIGSAIAFGYVFIKNYFDTTIKSPEDLEKRNINVLSWIPHIEGAQTNGENDYEFIVAKKPDSVPSEAFKALRTRVQFSRIDNDAIKTILITSAAQQEGKTTVAVNLAGSFAQANRKTLIIDCDLRKPRLHNVFNAERIPGLIDYLFKQVKFEDIVHSGGIDNFYYIPAGTIPPNPSEMLESRQMREFLADMKKSFDLVVLDSAPIIAVTDSEILCRLADASILVVSADTTESQLMEKAVELMKSGSSSFIGTVLNNFNYRTTYGSYYKYYYYYARPTNGIKNRAT
ncbi:MAG TPA: polysaccharide biosynthesis tyrosine autokinase [Ignavibacteriaceae bacterium]|nr:polysaccharide biosynthesis tyrosine autokinase [Ignavibacteriaceae bacterium]